MKRTFCILAVLIMMTTTAHAGKFKVTSPHLKPGGTLADAQILNGFGCSGKNESPALYWENSPGETKSFAVTVYDPDAPTGSGWWHWTLFNIPATANGLPSGAGKTNPLPDGAIEGRTDFGAPGFGGACPPEGHGPHSYHFRIWALDVDKIPLDREASGAMVGYFLNKHKLAVAEIIMTYER